MDFNSCSLCETKVAIRAGSNHFYSEGVLVAVRNIFMHPMQNDWRNFDFSLLELAEPLVLSESIQPIELPTPGQCFSDGTFCKVSGWGQTGNVNVSRYFLRGTTVAIYNQEKCAYNYRYLGTVKENMLCAGYDQGGKDSCAGDSGGPLVCNGVLAGIVSWGGKCAEAGQPGVYGRVTSALNWITGTINSETLLGSSLTPRP
ncbi:trypsin-1-like isoform X2 [Malaya genurostris]|uniref:trypsin-1-like isoform X2 n=1 Tax=Malaya genurostris TaxID=325434 RepID=UPI0026F3916B|nr:trypsin-1-like isoform X2 [Malaya genurostris]